MTESPVPAAQPGASASPPRHDRRRARRGIWHRRALPRHVLFRTAAALAAAAVGGGISAAIFLH